ncbi:TatD family deoxyribonuclease [Corallincola luteus]|uniref:TatD family deoxyribonuclease n=1 Tax=Corallincola luteus TaxID=1775177 RepID=A0ABY2AJ69_9GAMM|nr:TatD family deoxyribonuclease [Corallincola luteus]
MINVLVDSHCHLDLDPFSADLALVIRRAQAAGVTRLVVPAVSAKRWPALLALAEQYAPIYIALGLHPYFQAEHSEPDLLLLESLLAQRHPKVVAVGECGLDWVIADADRAKQQTLLEQQWLLAEKFELPVILHVRKAHPELLSLLKAKPAQKGAVIHAFSGSLQLANDYIQHGCLLGIGGVITYPRAAKTRAAVAALPLSKLLLETDAPDMPLAGFQGQRNEPARVVQVAESLAALKQLPLADIYSQTGANATQLFGFKP